MIRIYTQPDSAQQWLQRYRGARPGFACVVGFTETGLIEGISAAGATPRDRRYTAIADAEFLYGGATHLPKYPLPPLTAGASPALISRAIVEALDLPLYLIDAGLAEPLPVPAITLHGAPARCLTTGQAMAIATVEHLLEQGLHWGATLAREHEYLVLGECVVGGTTTALAVLVGLGIDAAGKVGSSHLHCNHAQKWAVVQAGLQRAGFDVKDAGSQHLKPATDPLHLVACVGDPVQVAIAGMTLAASRQGGVLLAGGTQMLAIYALAEAIAQYKNLTWQPENIIAGTTRWVAEDPTSNTVGLAESVATVPLLATALNFSTSRYPQLRAYERGYVKEGVGAGGCAIAASLYQDWQERDLLRATESLMERVFCI